MRAGVLDTVGTRSPQHHDEVPVDCPAPEAPFSEKMAFYRTQHTTKGVQATHMIAVPMILTGMPLIFTKPKVGLPMFVAAWALNILGHRVFEKNMPSTSKGWITYQLTGLIHVSELYGQMLARRSQRKVLGYVIEDPNTLPGDRHSKRSRRQ
jgi:hypothetical protein